MKTFKKLIIELIALLFIFSCTSKNLFYGIDAEDIEGPAIYIDYPSTSQTLSGTFTLIGRAQDKGGNEVLKVEVSVNGGLSWRLASGTTNWSLTVDSILDWGTTSGTETVMVRAFDTNYKTNSNQISRNYNYDNTNPGVTGSIADAWDTPPLFYRNATTAATPISYEWTPVPGAHDYQVSLYRNGALLGTFTGLDAGSTIVGGYPIDYDLDPLSASNFFRFTGNHPNYFYITVIARDAATNQIGASQTGQRITVDTALPAIGAGINFRVNGQTSGVIISTNPTFTWVPGQISDAHSGIDYITLNVSGQPTVTLAGNTMDNYTMNLANGVYTATLTAFDKAGNSTSTAVFNFTVNKTAPVDALVITRGAGYTAYHNAFPLIFQWANPGANVAGYDIQVIRNDGCIDSITNIPVTGGASAVLSCSGNITLAQGANTTVSFNGVNGYSFSIRVTTYNNAGLRATTSYNSPSIFVDTTPPTVPVLSLINGNPAVNPSYSNTANNLFLWNASTDAASGIDYYQISTDAGVSVNGANITTGTSVSRALADGTYSIKIRARDIAGNFSAWSAANINLTVNAAGPGAPTVVQVAGNTGPLYYNTAGNRAVSWTAPGAVGAGIAYYQISLDDGALVSGANETITTGVNRNFVIKTNGPYLVRVRTVDLAGTKSAWSAAVTVHVENVVPGTPTGLTVAGSNGPLYYNTIQNQVISWVNPTDGAGSGIASYQISLDNGVTSAGVITNGGNQNFPIQAAAYQVRVRALDNAGNTGVWSSAVTVYVENTVPAVPTVFRVNGSGVTPQYGNGAGIFALSWTASAGDGLGSGVAKYRVYNGGVLLQDNIGGTAVSLSLALGTYNFTMRTVDYAGNESGDSNQVQVIIENTPPTDIAFTVENYSIPNGEFTWDASIDGSGIKGYYVELEISFDGGVSWVGWIAQPFQPGVSFSYDMTAYAVGTQIRIRVRAEDNAGNFSGWVTSAVVTKP